MDTRTLGYLGNLAKALPSHHGCFGTLVLAAVVLGLFLHVGVSALSAFFSQESNDALNKNDLTSNGDLCNHDKRFFKSHKIKVEDAVEERGVKNAGLLRRLARKLVQSKRLILGDGSGRSGFDIRSNCRNSSCGRSFDRASSEGSSSSRTASEWALALGRSKSGLRLESRWQPVMARISSGQDLSLHAQTCGSDAFVAPSRPFCHTLASSLKDSRQMEEVFVYNGHLAVDCLPFDTTDANMYEVKQVVLDQHLLQFGMLLGESSAELALGQQRGPPPLSFSQSTSGHSLFGLVDCPVLYAQGWEKLVEEHKPGLHYWVHRRHVRKGLYMYKSRTVYEQAKPEQMVAFTFADNTVRHEWDDSSMALQALPAPSLANDVCPLSVTDMRAATYARSSFVYSRTRFPPPMAQREYVFARRIWHKMDDGGCYCISRACDHPSSPTPECRTLRVEDFAAGFVIRAVPGIYHSEAAVEVVTNYFEDSRVNAGIVNMGIRKALWPMTQKSEAGFRRFVQAHTHLPLPTRCLPRFEPEMQRRAKPLLQNAVGSENFKPQNTQSELRFGSLCRQLSEDSVGELIAQYSRTPTSSGLVDDISNPDCPGINGSCSAAGTQLQNICGELEEPVHADTSLCNAAMFSGYNPALTHGLYLAPFLYSAYLRVWKDTSQALTNIIRALKSFHLPALITTCARKICWELMLMAILLGSQVSKTVRHHVIPWTRPARSWLSWFVCTLGGVRGSRGSGACSKCRGSQAASHLWKHPDPSLYPHEPPVQSFPLQEERSIDDVMAGQGDGESSHRSRVHVMRRRALVKGMVKAMSMAARAAGIPLLHVWLSAKLPGSSSFDEVSQDLSRCTFLSTEYAKNDRNAAVLRRVSDRCQTQPRLNPSVASKHSKIGHDRSRVLMDILFGWRPEGN
ncbi:hypothetical protein CEUSTIGMA_g12815.t1 [Chlamydomonas eustigma]|uniref:START domain-containing protein n=1 Tax=Chlamydomonas eustigma TaxID=1157962 RepID=A0A250XR20_9CHLO|nr:hypothetical protein CEUSTIGMA_g12815.t1 [Chlamydomonas eustigma]|eukprot:GAX85399.1 hypothetical protein CEUSTIGMA_g12815.t1 [Chlamydomonas eustigma]